MLLVSVIMPTYKQAPFIRRALDSLCSQEYEAWEAWVIDDGSPDDTGAIVQTYLSDSRFHYLRLEHNRGLGAAINLGLDNARGSLIAYLPSDDVLYANHLISLVRALSEHPEAVMVYSGVRHHYNRTATGKIDGYPLQLVQVMHRTTPVRWMEREELVTDDLDRMFWSRLRDSAGLETGVVNTAEVTCEWVQHPYQRHTLLQEPAGGINRYRQYYGVKAPLRVATSVGNRIDEVEHYRRFRERPDTRMATGGLKILLVGELAYNPERILALEERGHKLYALWMREPYWYNTVGPVPFGHVEDLDYNDWEAEIRRVKPDVIYALLNWQAVPFAHQVLTRNPGIPFVWHYKEGPFISLERGHWSLLMDLYSQSDGQIYCSPEMKDWMFTVAPGRLNPETAFVLDGDLPKKEWFEGERSPRIASQTGEFHTVVPGRPIGLHPHNVVELAEAGIHLHFYGDFIHGQWLEWIEKTNRMAPRNIHLHHHVDQENWVKEFSQYDAGWLHYFESENHGEIRRANWDDLNYPARISTLVGAGLPLLQRDNQDSIVATQSLARKYDVGIFFTGMQELRAQLEESERLASLQANAWQARWEFTFDQHADRLIDFFRRVIMKYHQNGGRDGNAAGKLFAEPDAFYKNGNHNR